MFFKADCYRVKTFRPGYCFIDISKDAEYKELLDLQKAGTLRERFPDKPRLNRHASNFHEHDMLFESNGTIKENLISLQVPTHLPNGIPNIEGIIDVTKEADAIKIMNSLVGFGDKRVCLDTAFGKDIQDKSQVKESVKPQVSDDFSQKAVPKNK